MVGKRILLAFAVALIALPFSALVSAQDAEGVIVSGLNNPRNIFFADDGTLYVAEAGNAGDQVVETNFGPVMVGASSRITAVPAGGEPVVHVGDLVSSEAFGGYIGASAVLVQDGVTWVVLGLSPETELGRATGVLILDESMNEVNFIDFAAIEAETNPDEDIPVSNPQDIAVADDGTVYVIDTSGNALYTVTADGEVTLFHVWEDLPVPTSVDVGPDGDIYVGFLSFWPHERGDARVERWSADGELEHTYERLTAVTDVLVDDMGNVYAVEMAVNEGEIGWQPNSGNVVMLTEDGETTIASGLNFPYGIAQSPDGRIAITLNSTFSEPDAGQVVWLDSVMTDAPMAGDAAAPAATEEASE